MFLFGKVEDYAFGTFRLHQKTIEKAVIQVWTNVDKVKKDALAGSHIDWLGNKGSNLNSRSQSPSNKNW